MSALLCQDVYHDQVSIADDRRAFSRNLQLSALRAPRFFVFCLNAPTSESEDRMNEFDRTGEGTNVADRALHPRES